MMESTIEDRVAIYNKRLDKAKIYGENLKIYFKEHAPDVIDEYGELDTHKASEYFEKLLNLANTGKTLADQDDDLVQAFATVGRAYCGIYDKWTGTWITALEESHYPPLCEECAIYGRY
ncbi:hypothetical protein [Nitrososphaera sp. AFS]|uniref:hypothetical protein n=1 Tax=Nitrososphaera sp. AFS TaxID=2301191 RepID=UPI001392370F|nr:hypothetical protein [Nitrososphaera sp. AFS]NAL78421.1 hypothetical protein [Nitrososphaera sp. AFS]